MKEVLIATPIIDKEPPLISYLEVGQIDIGSKEWNECFVELSLDQMQDIVGRWGKFYIYQSKMWFRPFLISKKMMKTVSFTGTVKEIEQFYKKHKPIIYSIIRDVRYDKYMLRYFDVKCNSLQYVYNMIFTWGREYCFNK